MMLLDFMSQSSTRSEPTATRLVGFLGMGHGTAVTVALERTCSLSGRKESVAMVRLDRRGGAPSRPEDPVMS